MNTTQHVQFRLSRAAGRSLQARARRRNLSPSIYARELVLFALEHDMREDLADLRDEFAAFREDVCGSLAAIVKALEVS